MTTRPFDGVPVSPGDVPAASAASPASARPETTGVRILHLSDTHLTASGLDEDGVDGRAALAGLLAGLRHLPPIDLVVVSGDLADDGSVGGYDAVLGQVGDFARRRGAGVVLTTGNHDARGPFSATLGSGHHDPAGTDVGTPGPDACAVSEHRGVRVIGLDSLVPGSGHGHLGRDQLTWLRDLLRTSAPRGTVVALHHPPIRLAGLPFHAQVVLDNPDDLEEVVRGSDVRLVLCGHLHHQLSGSLAGIPVWVGPAVITRVDLTSPPHLVRGVLGAGASVHELSDDGGCVASYVVHARDPRAGQQVYVYDPLTGQDVAES